MREKDLAIFSLFVVGVYIQSSSALEFGYSKREQHKWSHEFATCSGLMQSPIPLSSKKAVVLPLPALEMIGYHDFLTCSLSLKNNGHTVVLNFDKDSSKKPLPYIFGAMLNDKQKYGLESLHFHWGKENKRGSEHTLNGVRYPMEMHIVHRNLAYSKLEKAQMKNDGLSVLGIFFQLQEEDNDMLEPILENLDSLKSVNSEVRLDDSLFLSSLLPKDTDTYYTYRGSLTTPPCNEAVTWIIFSEPVPISPKQMSQFRLLRNGEEILADNFRQLQFVGRRRVFMRKLLPGFARLQEDQHSVNVTSLKWLKAENIEEEILERK